MQRARILPSLIAVSIVAQGFHGSSAAGSIAPTFQFRYVAGDVAVNDGEAGANDNDFQEAPDFSPFAAVSTSVAATPGGASSSAIATQDSTMDALEIHARGDAATPTPTSGVETVGAFAESYFELAFDIEQAGTYQLDANVATTGNGVFEADSVVDFKGPGGVISSIAASGNDSDAILPTLVDLAVGSYTIFAKSTATIDRVDSFSAGTFEMNLVYVIPEPSTLMSLLIGSFFVLSRRRASR